MEAGIGALRLFLQHAGRPRGHDIKELHTMRGGRASIVAGRSLHDIMSASHAMRATVGQPHGLGEFVRRTIAAIFFSAAQV